MSTRVEQAWIIDHLVVRRIAAGGHHPSHPFHISDNDISIGRRAELLQRIRDSNPDHVLPVDSVCECSYISPLLTGGPIQDFGLGADGNRLLHPNERRISWPAPELERHLAELAKGLAELHRIGIAHGDPALMNAYLQDAGDASFAVWVDLNSIQPATTEAVAMDLAAFESTCLWPALLDADQHSASLFDDLVAIASDADEPLHSYAASLAETRTDHTSGNARDAMLQSLRDADPLGRDDLLGSVRRRVAGAMAPMYFLDQTKSDQNARFFLSALTHERTRHKLLDEERTRLHGIRYQGEIASLQQQASDLERQREEFEARIQEAARDAADTIARLRDQVAEKEELGEALRATRNDLEYENAALRSDLNDIYGSRAWRLVASLRSLIAIPSRMRSRLRRSPDPGPPAAVVAAEPQLRAWNPPVENYPFMVSVIMPVYNKGATLEESIESVMTQTLSAVEVVLWDDESTDPDTMKVLDRVAELPNVTRFRGTNQGVVGARNSAIAFSRGRYICCLDPDDLIAPTYLEKAVALLESQPEYAIAYPWVESIGDIEELWETQDLDPGLITRANHVPVCAVFRREVFHETGGFSEKMEHGYEDWEFWVHAAELGFRGKSIPSHLFNYRFSLDAVKSRDAQARESHQELVEAIARLHPRIARTGVPFVRPGPGSARRVGSELGPRRLPAGNGRPVVITLPWFTVGGADRVVESLIGKWLSQGRTVVTFVTNRLAPGMTDRRHELDALTPYTYHLVDLLPANHWYEFVAGVLSALDSPVILNIGSAWFYEKAETLRRDFPHLRMVDQQFNSIGHLSGNRNVAGVIDLTIAAYERLADEIASDDRATAVVPVYVGIDDVTSPLPSQIEEFKERAGIRRGERLVLFVGRLAEEKRPDWAIKLASELAEDGARVVIVGDGPLRDDVAEAIRSELGLIWIPKLDTVESAIAAAALLILPSTVEGIPLVAMEALALGTPIVATRVGGLPDLENEEGVTLVDVDDFEAFVEAVRMGLETRPPTVLLPDRFSAAHMLEQYDRLLFATDSSTHRK